MNFYLTKGQGLRIEEALQQKIEEIALEAGCLIEADKSECDFFKYEDYAVYMRKHRDAFKKNLSDSSRRSYILAAMCLFGAELTVEDETKIEEADSAPAADHFQHLVGKLAKERSATLYAAYRLAKHRGALGYEIVELLANDISRER